MLKRDPDNQFWWKREPRRLEAEIIRDNALAVSGLLDRSMYGPGTLNQGMKRRSIYFMVKRSKLIPMMQVFDWPDTMTSQGRRAVTTTAVPGAGLPQQPRGPRHGRATSPSPWPARARIPCEPLSNVLPDAVPTRPNTSS